MFKSLLIGYAIGSIPWAVLISRWLGTRDPRYAGSGNVGAVNTLRLSGPGPAALVAVLDAAKGATSVVVASYLEPITAPAAAVAAMAGHAFPVWLGFRGGKAVAAAGGAFGVLSPAAAGVSLVVFVAAVWRTGHASVGSLLAAATLPPMVYLTSGDWRVLMASCVAAGLIVVRHQENLARLRAGTEATICRRDPESRWSVRRSGVQPKR